VVAASTGKTSAKVAKSGKQKKIKREKVRFGQAPRNSLPPGPQETTIGQDRGAGAVPAAVAEGITTAPGQAIAPVDPNAQAAATTEADPLAPQVEPKKKSRYAAREKELQAAKKQKKVAAAKEKAAAAPPPITQEEKEAQQTQAAPLGLNGDTAKKKKKKKVKGAAKERLQGKPKAPAAPAPEATPYRTPDLNPKPGTPAAPSSDKTTLPPANAPAPGALPQGEVAPATPGSPIPTPAPN
jgi:peptidyl-prolyl cis-trans isomerase SurA